MIKWHEVTWFSKLGAAIVLFVVIPYLSFLIGIRYNQAKELYESTPVPIDFTRTTKADISQ